MKSIYVVSDSGVPRALTLVTTQAIMRTLELAGLSGQTTVKEFQNWRQLNYRDNLGELAPHMSIDWYVEQVRKVSREGQLFAQAFFPLWMSEPWQKSEPHYEVTLVSEDIYDVGLNFCFGITFPGVGMVLSTRRFQDALDKYGQTECFRTLALHETGHLFGLVSRQRPGAVELLGSHCANKCVMRQGLTLNAFVDFTNNRLQDSKNEFCSECLTEIRRFGQEIKK